MWFVKDKPELTVKDKPGANLAFPGGPYSGYKVEQQLIETNALLRRIAAVLEGPLYNTQTGEKS